jgi:hypothetical protein
MTLGYAIHLIPFIATGTAIHPGTVAEFEDFDELKALGAVREATADETAAYEHRAAVINAATAATVEKKAKPTKAFYAPNLAGGAAEV